jgi:DNA-binding NtrC family response regulator
MIPGIFLVVDDEKTQRETLRTVLESWGHQVQEASSGQKAMELLEGNRIDVILTDLRMPGMTGLDLLKAAKEARPDIDVIVMTAYGSVEGAVQAMKIGAVDFITKPVDLDQLEIVLRRTLDRKALVRENKVLKRRLEESVRGFRLLGDSEAMQAVLAKASRVASTDATVLVQGASGTGKELLAHSIHDLSHRAEGPFVAVNCAALPESLLESELFGHVKGAFTGADRDRAGRVRQAEGGTLFLDEIGDIAPMVQVKLLRFLQDRQYTPVGSEKLHQASVRVITATHRDLQQRITEGEFREDLFFRLNVVNLELPTLAARREDIPQLSAHFLVKYTKRYERVARTFSSEAMAALMAYSYRGNVRELENIVEQAVVMTTGEVIHRDDLPPILTGNTNANQPEVLSAGQVNGDLPALMEKLEKRIIMETLATFDGNQSSAARHLGLTESGLRYKLTKWKQ